MFLLISTIYKDSSIATNRPAIRDAFTMPHGRRYRAPISIIESPLSISLDDRPPTPFPGFGLPRHIAFRGFHPRVGTSTSQQFGGLNDFLTEFLQIILGNQNPAIASARIRELIGRHTKSKRAVSSSTGLDRAPLRRYINGEAGLNLDSFIKLLTHFASQ